MCCSVCVSVCVCLCCLCVRVFVCVCVHVYLVYRDSINSWLYTYSSSTCFNVHYRQQHVHISDVLVFTIVGISLYGMCVLCIGMVITCIVVLLQLISF